MPDDSSLLLVRPFDEQRHLEEFLEVGFRGRPAQRSGTEAMIRRDDDQGPIVEADAPEAVHDPAQDAIGVTHLEYVPLDPLDVEPLVLGHLGIVETRRNHRRAGGNVLPARRKGPERNMGQVQVQVVQRRPAVPTSFQLEEKAVDDTRNVLVEAPAARVFLGLSRSTPVTESGPGLVDLRQTGPEGRRQQQVAVHDAEVVGHGGKTFSGTDRRRLVADGRWTEDRERFVRDNPVAAPAQP